MRDARPLLRPRGLYSWITGGGGGGGERRESDDESAFGRGGEFEINLGRPGPGESPGSGSS